MYRRRMHKLAAVRYRQNVLRRSFGAMKAVCFLNVKQREVGDIAYRMVKLGTCMRRWYQPFFF